MKKTTRNRISTLLIIAGIAMAMFPLGDRLYTWYWQNRALESYEQLSAVFAEEENVGPEQEDGQSNQSGQAGEPGPASGNEEAPESQPEQKPAPPPIKPIGIVKIPKIDVNLPILEGATKRNLKVGAGWLTETSKLGEVGNTALAAHRSYTYGRFFNRLDEVEIGDEIIIEANGTEYRYTVFEKLAVEPEDRSVLARNKKDRVLTLITCTPIKVATHRLIIHAKLE